MEQEPRSLLGPRGAAVAALLLGILLVVALEWCVRYALDVRIPPLVVDLVKDGKRTLRSINPDYARRFFSGVDVTGMRMTPYPFVEPRPPNALRVVVVGGSTVQGYPHPRRLTASAYIQAMLQKALPDQHIEVFNLGITAISSFAVARTVEDAMVLEPDAVVIYTGHNEIYGVYGSASLSQGGSSLWAKELHYRAMQWGLTTLVRRALQPLAESGGEVSTSLLRVMSAAGTVADDDARRGMAEENLRANVLDMIETTRAHGAVPILCTVASNERGFAPAYIEPPVESRDLADWKDRLGRAQDLYNARDYAASLDDFDGLVEAYGASAWTQFFRGRCLEMMGRDAEARRAYIRARDLDPTPWRASSALSEIIRTTAREQGAAWMDGEALFAQYSPPAGIGWELMDDHVHPSARGQVLLARGIAEVLLEQIGSDRASETIGLADETYEAIQGDTPLERLAVYHDMHILLSEEPMSRGNEQQAATLAEQADSLWKVLAPGEQSGYQRWRSGKGPAILALNAADQLFASGDIQRAAIYYRAASLEEPFTPWGDMWATLRWGRSLQLSTGLGQAERARIKAMQERLSLLAQSPDLSPGLANFFSGYAQYLLEGAGIELLEGALGDAQVRRLFFYDLLAILSEKLPEMGRRADAERYIRTVSDEVGQPDYGRFLLARMR